MSASRTTAGTASERITDQVGAWTGVESGWGRRGEFAFKVGRHEIGHLHGDHAAHFFFPKDVWTELLAAGRIAPHPVFPDKQGPAARRIAGEEDIQDVVAMMRLNYDRIQAAAAAGGDER
jgi:Luciferase